MSEVDNSTDDFSILGGSGDVFVQIEMDLANEEEGVDLSIGVVLDLDHVGQSGIFASYGEAKGGNVGVGAGVGYVKRDIEGSGTNLDANIGPVSPTLMSDDQGINGGAFGVGPGFGGSGSETETNTLSVNELGVLLGF